MKTHYDYIIVGGGSAGCVLANRLSNDPTTTVLLLESGNDDTSPLVHLPVGAVAMVPTHFNNWALNTVPQRHLANNPGYQPRGKVLGGSSAINAMIYIRGHKHDYDDWSHLGWSWDAVLPYFIKSENNTLYDQLDCNLHGNEGLLNVSESRSKHPVAKAFINSAIELGHPHNPDFNGQAQEGVGFYHVTQKNGKRASAAVCYLNPIRHRPNLTIKTNTNVSRLLISAANNIKSTTSKAQCKGVLARVEDTDISFYADKEVLLCAGALHSPQLLMLSGIGDPQELNKHHIKVNVELPGVGQNLQDHPDYVSCYHAPESSLFGLSLKGTVKLAKQAVKFMTNRTGQLTSNFAEAGGFLKTDPSLDRPDIQFHFVVAAVNDHARDWRTAIKHGFSNHICVLRPKSKGRVFIKSSNIKDAPLIDPNFMAEQEDVDVLIKGLKLSNQILTNGVIDQYKATALKDDLSEDDTILEQRIRAHTDSVYHPVGTCKMGLDNDYTAVVSPELNVYGVSGLRVVDASVFPNLIGGNTNAPTIMLAERAADIILNKTTVDKKSD